MNSDTLKSDFVLFFVASIWGLAFVAQRIGMDHIGPFTFNGIRFVLGCISLLPVIYLRRNKSAEKNTPGLLKSGIISGIFLFAGISLQQVGLVYTTAGKAGFITGLYVVLVPLLGVVLKQDTPSKGTWIGALLAGTGLYLLSVTQDMTIEFGDLLVLLSAVCFAFHLIIIARFAVRFNAASLCLVQCLVCSILSLLTAMGFETFVLADILNVLVPLFYGGIMSVGVAYSLQIYGQKNSPPSHAAIILCLESLVAAIGGWVILNELLSVRAVLGCALMLTGMLVSQLVPKKTFIS
jgi:drug/metabolite transporter (DMT)-like permease